MKIGIILNSIYTEDEMEDRRKYFESKSSKMTELEFFFPTKRFPEATPSPEFLTSLALDVVRKAKEAESKKCDAVVVYNSYDPGVDTAMSMVNIPVVGSGRIAYHIASLLADRICVIACEGNWIPLTYRLAKTLGFDHLITTPIRALDIPVPEMKSRRKEAKQRMIELAKKGIEEGGQVIFPQGLNSLSVHVPLEEIEKEIGCPIVDAVPLAIKHAEIFVELGISQSKLAYPYHSS